MTTLRARPSNGPPRPATAWCIPGADPRDWLEELSRWNTDLRRIRLLVLPDSIGVLAIPDRPETIEPFRARPFHVFGGRLWLPVDAEVWPPIDEAEIERGLPVAGVESVVETFVLMPRIGLVAYGADDASCVADLLERPRARRSQWRRPVVETTVNDRLLSVVADVESALPEELLSRGRGEIGADSVDEAPETPLEEEIEERGVIEKGRRRLLEGLARVVRYFTDRAPESASEPTWVDRLDSWARGVQDRDWRESDLRRHKELYRLLHWLSSDPDQALRYAIPIGDRRFRGLTRGADRLQRRDIKFDLARLGRVGAGDPWVVPNELALAITEQYRLLAQDALESGDVRRAAYIQAHLLGDLELAASTLKGGGYYMEAATLYEKSLGQMVEAARCYLEAGDHQRAVEIFEEQGRYLEAASGLERVGDHARAREFYRREVDLRAARGDLLGAADIIEERLRAPEEALTLLENGWSLSRQPRKALERTLNLCATIGRHDRAQRIVDGIVEKDEPLLPALEAFAAVSYPDAKIQARISDGGRVLGSRLLQDCTPRDANRILDGIRRLDPGDRLLATDTQRFGRGMPRRVVRWFGDRDPMPHGRSGPWSRLFDVNGAHFLIGAIDADHITVVREVSAGGREMVRWRRGEPVLSRLGVAVHPAGDHVVLWNQDWGPFPSGTLSAIENEGRTHPACTVGTPPWLPKGVQAVAFGAGPGLWLVRSNPDLTRSLCEFTRNGELIQEVTIPTYEGVVAVLGRCALVVRGRVACVAAGTTLHRFADGAWARIGLLDDVRTLHASPESGSESVVATHDQGASLIKTDTGEVHPFAATLDRPLVTYLPGGGIVAAATNVLNIHSLGGRSVTLTRTVPVDALGSPRALVSSGPDSVKVLDEHGRLRQIPIR